VYDAVSPIVDLFFVTIVSLVDLLALVSAFTLSQGFLAWFRELILFQ
jgi:hypothetical protein